MDKEEFAPNFNLFIGINTGLHFFPSKTETRSTVKKELEEEELIKNNRIILVIIW